MCYSVQRSNLQPVQRQQAPTSHPAHVTDLHHANGELLVSKALAAPAVGPLSHSYTAPAGAAKNGFSQPQIHPVKSRTQQQPHARALNGTAVLQLVAAPGPARGQTSNPMPGAKPARPLTHSHQPLTHSQQHQHQSSSGPSGGSGAQQPAPRLCSGPQHTQQPNAEAQQHQHQLRPSVPLGSTSLAQPNLNAPPNSLLESAQTALPQTALPQKHPNKGKPNKAPAPLSDEVIQQVCAAAKLGQKETVLTALLQCKPCKNQVCHCLMFWAPRHLELEHKQSTSMHVVN